MLSLPTARSRAYWWPKLGAIGNALMFGLVVMLVAVSAPHLADEVLSFSPARGGLAQIPEAFLRLMSLIPIGVIAVVASAVGIQVPASVLDTFPRITILRFLTPGNLLGLLLVATGAALARLKQMGLYLRNEVQKYDDWQQQQAWSGTQPASATMPLAQPVAIKETSFADSATGKWAIGVASGVTVGIIMYIFQHALGSSH